MHQKYFVPFQLNWLDVKSTALEGDKHITVLQVLYGTKRLNFPQVTHKLQYFVSLYMSMHSCIREILV